MTDLSFDYQGQKISLMINNFQDFKKYFLLQNGNNWYWINQPNGFDNWVKRKLHHILTFTSDMIDYNFNSILDIGSGLGLYAIAIKQMIPGLKVFLVDYDGINFGKDFTFYNQDATNGYYNSWHVVRDIIDANGLNHDDFVFLHPNDTWPKNIDFIRSRASWCWHYPFETYWQSVQNSMSSRAQLWTDIYWRLDLDVVDIISRFMNSKPRSSKLVHRNQIKNRFNKVNPLGQAHFVGDYFGGSYSWKKSRWYHSMLKFFQ
jgi:hypothetical protein